MKYHSSVFFIFIAVVFSGCSSPEEPQKDALTVRDLYPVGIKWTYQHNDYDDAGNKTPRYTTERSVDTSATYRGHDAFDLDLDYDHIEFYYEADTAMYWFDRKTGTTELGFRYPMTEGQEYIYSVNGLPTEHQDLKILVLRKKAVSITVAAGTFDCLVYEKMNCSAEGGGSNRYNEY
ncbi:MAG TPA: hypothetical protein VFO76_00960 [Candidatus Kapabacteria bacterium]|nr:hypothetical protein [Candidatus Kapabacteria bacterium]